MCEIYNTSKLSNDFFLWCKMAVPVEICKVLCYVQNKIAVLTNTGLLTTVSSFYTMEEVVVAKTKLYYLVEKLCDEGVIPPECKHCKKQENRVIRSDA